ncbi:Linoleate 9S-lipoxygenase-4 [Glycine soja]
MEPIFFCVKCLRLEVDITEGLLKRLVLVHCPKCQSCNHQEVGVKLQLESKELLTFCLKKLQKNLNSNKVRLVHAEFIWTEPHSRRVKVKVKVQKEVLNGAILEQSYPMEYVQQEHMCESCSRVQANPDQWVAAATCFSPAYFLLFGVADSEAWCDCHCYKNQADGTSHGVKFVEFIRKIALVRSRHDKQLKYTFSVEINPIFREDLICVPPRIAAGLGNIGPLVTNNIALLDPFTLRHCFIDVDQYWRASFKSLLTSRQLVDYIVLDVETVSSEVTIGGTKYRLADAQVARISDFGKTKTDYPYASDGLEIWDDIKSWVEEYVSFYYKSAEELQKDPELQAWWKELVEYPYGGLILNRPTISRRFMLEKGSLEYDALAKNPGKEFLKPITGKKETLIDLTIIEILSRHASDEFYPGQRDGGEYWTSDAGPLEAFKRFGKNLEEIEKKLIEKNNDETLRNRYGPAKMPYTLLYPSSEEGLTFRGIPNSISI